MPVVGQNMAPSPQALPWVGGFSITLKSTLLVSPPLQHPLSRTPQGSQFEGKWRAPSWEELAEALLSSVQFISVAQSCPTLCDPMNRSTPGLPVHHHLLEFTQTHVHRVCDAIQPSHPLSSPSSPAPNPLQHQSFFQ